MSTLHSALCRVEFPSPKARVPGQQRKMPVLIKILGSPISKWGERQTSWSSLANVLTGKGEQRDRTCTKKVPVRYKTSLWESKDSLILNSILFIQVFWNCDKDGGGLCCMLVTLRLDVWLWECYFSQMLRETWKTETDLQDLLFLHQHFCICCCEEGSFIMF